MNPTSPLTLDCPAKVNLALSVGAADQSGLHPLASWMVAINFSDTLTLATHPDGPSRFDITPADNNTQARPATPLVTVDWPLETDLAVRAHTLLEKEAARSLPVYLTLRKRIPTGAGLGGGSSNAAATLIGLNRLFTLNLDRRTLIQLGQRLGSDVGFLISALLGQPSALITGLGEQIEPLPQTQPIHLLLICPQGLACPTGQVYAAFDRLNLAVQPPGPDIDRVRQVVDSTHPSSILSKALFNDLEQPAFDVQPSLKTMQEELIQHLDTPVHVTGSGSTLFATAPSADACHKMAAQASTLPGFTAIATRTLQAANQTAD